MPYDSNEQTPPYVRGLPAKQQRRWRHVWNSAYSSCMASSQPDSGRCESSAFAQANGVVKGGAAKHSMDEAAFKELTTQARKSIPKAKFLVPNGSDGKPHLPVHDEAHIRNAISRLGSSKTGRKWGLTPEKRVQLQRRAQNMLKKGTAKHSEEDADLALDVVTFKVKDPVREGPDVVYRPAKIFRAGDYPDKNFALTADELKAAAAEFDKPINVDYEHIQGPLDGHFGQLVAVEPTKDGSRLDGILAVPRWLHTILPDMKLSATWDRATKKLVGLGMVRNPRVPDAALFAAFTVDEVLHGRGSMEDIVRFAVPKQDDDDDDDDDKASGKDKFLAMIKAKKGKKKGKKAKFADGMVASGGYLSQSGGSHDAQAKDIGKQPRSFAMGKGPYGRNPNVALAQVVHDVTVQRGAVCRVEPQPGKMTPYGIVKFANGSLQTIHDTSLKMGATCVPTLYGQRTVPGGAPWTWEWPGVSDEGRKGVSGDVKAPHFSGGIDKMGNAKKLAKFLAELDDSNDGRPEYGAGITTAVPAQSNSERILAEELAQQREENRKMRQQGIYDRAVTFADKAVVLGHVLPVERDNIVTLHMQAGNDDTFVGTASFSDGESRVSQFEKYVLGRPKHLLDVEAAAEAMSTATAMFNRMKTANTPSGDTGAPMSAERRTHLLNLTHGGKMLLADEKKNGRST